MPAARRARFPSTRTGLRAPRGRPDRARAAILTRSRPRSPASRCTSCRERRRGRSRSPIIPLAADAGFATSDPVDAAMFVDARCESSTPSPMQRSPSRCARRRRCGGRRRRSRCRPPMIRRSRRRRSTTRRTTRSRRATSAKALELADAVAQAPPHGARTTSSRAQALQRLGSRSTRRSRRRLGREARARVPRRSTTLRGRILWAARRLAMARTRRTTKFLELEPDTSRARRRSSRRIDRAAVMRVLGLESSCDETAAAIVDDGRVVRADVVASQNEVHARYGGVVPELASRAHILNVVPVVQAALDRAGCTLDDDRRHRGDQRAGARRRAARRPADREGARVGDRQAARRRAPPRGPPVARSISSPSPPPMPHLALIVSGGHTSLVRVDGARRRRRARRDARRRGGRGVRQGREAARARLSRRRRDRSPRADRRSDRRSRSRGR